MQQQKEADRRYDLMLWTNPQVWLASLDQTFLADCRYILLVILQASTLDAAYVKQALSTLHLSLTGADIDFNLSLYWET